MTGDAGDLHETKSMLKEAACRFVTQVVQTNANKPTRVLWLIQHLARGFVPLTCAVHRPTEGPSESIWGNRKRNRTPSGPAGL